MRGLKYLALAVMAGVAFTIATPKTQAQVDVTIGSPDCPYGFYDYAPYNCAPYGYYGPEWFNGGVFIGAGKWFHGPEDFKGNVDNHFDAKHGYKGPAPARGEKPTPEHPVPPSNFKGNEARDGRGHVAKK
jgi:hypothetical protein